MLPARRRSVRCLFGQIEVGGGVDVKSNGGDRRGTDQRQIRMAGG